MVYEIQLRHGAETFCSARCVQAVWLATPSVSRPATAQDTRCAFCHLPLRDDLGGATRPGLATIRRLDPGHLGDEQTVSTANRAVSEAAWHSVQGGMHPFFWTALPQDQGPTDEALRAFRTTVADFAGTRAYVELPEGTDGVARWVRADLRPAPVTEVEVRQRRLDQWRLPATRLRAAREARFIQRVQIPWPTDDIGLRLLGRFTKKDLTWWVDHHFEIPAPFVRVGAPRADFDEYGEAIVAFDLFPEPPTQGPCARVRAVQVRHDPRLTEGDRVIAPGRRGLTEGHVVQVDAQNRVRVVWADNTLEIIPRAELDLA